MFAFWLIGDFYFKEGDRKNSTKTFILVTVMIQNVAYQWSGH